MKTLVCLILLAIIYKQAEALQCFECDSDVNEGCMEDHSRYIKDCSYLNADENKLACSTELFHSDFNLTSASFNMKFKAVKKCTTSDIRGYNMKMTGNGALGNVITCTTNLCNPATKPAATGILAIGALSMILLLK